MITSKKCASDLAAEYYEKNKKNIYHNTINNINNNKIKTKGYIIFYYNPFDDVIITSNVGKSSIKLFTLDNASMKTFDTFNDKVPGLLNKHLSLYTESLLRLDDDPFKISKDISIMDLPPKVVLNISYYKNIYGNGYNRLPGYLYDFILKTYIDNPIEVDKFHFLLNSRKAFNSKLFDDFILSISNNLKDISDPFKARLFSLIYLSDHSSKIKKEVMDSFVSSWKEMIRDYSKNSMYIHTDLLSIISDTDMFDDIEFVRIPILVDDINTVYDGYTNNMSSNKIMKESFKKKLINYSKDLMKLNDQYGISNKRPQELLSTIDKAIVVKDDLDINFDNKDALILTYLKEKGYVIE